MTVSVLMPVYNAERYLSAAVESILSQTFRDFEFLVVDDGSTDESLSILRRYAQQDPRMKLTSRANGGYATVLNDMLTQAQGELLARMDADDVALPDRFEREVGFLRQHPEVVAVSGPFEYMDEKGRRLTVLKVPPDDGTIQKTLLQGNGCMGHPGVMMRADAVRRVGGYDPAAVPCECLDLMLRLGEVGKLANLSEPVLRYRMHIRSVTALQGHRLKDRARYACEAAYRRRNLPPQFHFEQTELLVPTGESRFVCRLTHGWWAFNSRHWRTAIIYGAAAVAQRPWSMRAWRLLVCAVSTALGENGPPN